MARKYTKTAEAAPIIAAQSSRKELSPETRAKLSAQGHRLKQINREAAEVRRELKTLGYDNNALRELRPAERKSLLDSIKGNWVAPNVQDLGPDPTLALVQPPPTSDDNPAGVTTAFAPDLPSDVPPKPGTRAFNDAQDPMFRLPDQHTDEAISERNQFKVTPSVVLTLDEMTKKLRSTHNPFDEAAAPFIKANPNESFAYQSPRVQAKLGTRGMQPVFKDGKMVVVAGQILMYESKQAREFKDKLSAQRAKEQSANAIESYREIQERIIRARNTLGDDRGALRDGEIFIGDHGASYGPDGAVVEHGGGAVKIGIVTGNNVDIVR